MKSLTKYNILFVCIFLLITNSVSSNALYRNLTNSIDIENFYALSVSGIFPTSGHAGTIVTITGASFTPTSIVLLGALTIPSANIQFVSATELKVTLPCGMNSGFFTVDGITSTILFTYIEPTISTVLPNLSYCVGTTVPQIVLSGTPAVPTTPTSLEFTWTNANTTIGLIGNGVGNLPTFTSVNATLEPISSTITVTPSINGCSGTSKSYTIAVNPLPVATPISNILVCAGTNINQIVLTASSPNAGTGTSFSWNGTNNAAIGLSTTSGITSPIPSFTAINATNAFISSTISVNPSFQGCLGTATNFTIQVAPSVSSAPTIGTITQPTCTIATGSVILSGLPAGNWTITKLPGGQTYSNSGNTYTITNLTSGTYTFSVSNGTCSSSPSQNAVILNEPIQTEPIVGLLLQPSCTIPTGSVTLSGLPAGNWTLTRSPDGVLYSGTGSSTTISGVASGIYNYSVTNSSSCISALSSPVLINSQPAAPPAPIANAQSFLASANATVSNLQIVSSGTPIWYTNAVGGTAIPSSTLLATGLYYASQTINGCESINRTLVNVSVFPSSSGGSVLGTTTVCFGTNSTVLTLSGYTGIILRWESSTVSDFLANVLPINNQSATYTALNLTAPLYFRAVVQSGISPLDYSSPAFIDVVAQSNGGNLSPSTSVCSGQNSGILSVSGYIGTIIRWEQSVDNGVNWTSIINTSNSYTSGILVATTQYRVVVQNGICPAVLSTVATITLINTPIVTDFPNQQVCFGDTNTFGDPFVAGYTYSWTSDIGYSSILPQISITFGQVVTQTYTYSITNTVTGCSAQDQFQVIVNPLPTATVITNTSICEGNSINIGANSTIGSTYSWTSIPSGFISANSNPSVNPAVTTTYILEETTTATGCKKANQTVITVQPIPVLTIVGSPQFNICETTTQVQLNATIINPYASFVWTKIIGSGSFDNSTILNPIYSPSAADVVLGSVTLRLSVIGLTPCVATYTQDVVIIIDKNPIANAGLDVITCGTNPIQINAIGTLNATNLVWTLPSGISGTLDQSNPYTPIFTPSANDLNYVGPIIISLTASSNTNCPTSSDTVSVLITPAPVVDAGPPTAIICQGSNYIVPFNLTASQNIVNSTILWTKGTGDGTIVGSNSLTPTYIPGPIDIANGTVTLTLSASGNNPCSTPATDSIIVTIVKNPIVNAGADTLVCQGSINVNATIQNAGTILWTVTNGNGNFVDPTASSPIYIPAPTDLNTTVTFTVAVTPINACGPTVSDSVLYTIKASPSVVAGSDATICQSNATFQLQATASNTTLITWTTTGSGSFDNIHNEDPIYTLSPNDINAGSVTFTITGAQSSCPDATDIIVLTIQKNPIANAGPAQIICQGDSVLIPGTSNNSNTFSWVRNGGTGTFINTNTTNPTYTSQLSESGTIYLTLIADAIAPCTVSANSNTTIDIIPRATADAGLDAQICEGGTFQITTAGATNNVGVQWSTNGDGTFTGGSTISPIYTPGPSDNNNGSVTLTLVATKNFPCNANAVDQMTLIINKIPVITVINPDVDLCVGDPFYIVSGVVPTNYDTLSWSTSGSGTFAPNTTAIAPTYFPSASDYTLGTVTLTLTASRNPLNCNSSSSNTITLHFITKPTADAGPVAATICEGSFYVTNGAIASNFSNVTWSSSGSGTFTNATTFLANYTPSALDYTLGFVNLTLTANTISPCTGVAIDVIRLNLQRAPQITVRANDAICNTQNTYAIGGTSVTDYVLNSEVWSSSGTGTFSPSGDALNPVYNPSSDDLAAGFVTLTITVNSIAPCVIPVSNSFGLNFQKLPVANAGPTIIACDTPFQITTATATLSTVSNLVWSTSGTGTFDYTNILDPIYTPSTFDVLNSPITLTLTANAIAPCTTASVTTVLLNIVNSPIITVVNQLPICEDATNVTVLGTTVQFQSSFVWTSATGTTISNNSILNPIVTPSAQDIINNQMILTITAQPVAPCGVPVSKTVVIPIQKKPIVAAGTSQTICEGNIITTSDALSSNVTNLRWDNNGGDGTFTTSNLNTVTEYTPGPNEIASGQVLLTIIGDAISPCSGTVTNTVTHTIIKNPIVTINPTEVTICETQTSYMVPATFVTLVNPSSILNYQWTTPNMASLTGASTWTPTYSPTAADIASGFVYLTLTVNPIAPCATPIIKSLKINISKQATIAFANDGFFCEGQSKPLSVSFTDYNPASISWAIVNGTGSITGANTATPTYIPASDSGTVVIRISVESLIPCANTVTQDFTITVIKRPIVDMTTTSDTVCSSQLTYNLSGNTTQFANSILWTRENPVGTGTFSNSTILNPVYTFNAADIANGFVTLRLTATSGANCGFTDFKEITITITKEPTVVTAPIDTICQGAIFTASATATNNSSVLWSTVGTSNGLFSNANQLVTQYTPGSNDITSFTIQVTAFGNAPCAAVVATKVVSIQQQPILDAGLESRANCSNQPYQITGVTGQYLGAILWTSNSGAPGTFSNATILNPTYTPSATELSAGLPIVLTITAQAVAPCTVSVSDFIILNLSPNQVVAAGTYPSICESDTVGLSGSASNAISVYWTTSGTGTFSAINSLNTNYVPSNSDIINGTVTLTLHAISNSNCPEVTNSTVITILKKPIASAGTNASICQGSSYALSAGEASAQNYTALTWTATGPGALSLGTINSLTPTYIPAVGQTGTVTLTLTATGYSACGINAVSTKTITIVPQPLATIPSSKTICEGATLVISNTDASAINYSSLQWTSSNGLGSFTPNNTAATIYTPATGQTGTVTLLLTATAPNGVCPSAVGTLLLDIIAKPIVEAGTNGTICQSGTYTVSGASVQNSTLYSWSISGAATIQAGTENTLNPVFVPNIGATGTVTGTLTAVGTGICPVVVTDFLILQINPIPAVNAGTDGTLCEGIPSFQLNGTVSNANSYTWTTTGGGIIQQTANPLAPLYVPSASDYATATGIKTITINLNATTTNGCSAVADTMQLTLYAKPKVNAGIDLLACQDSSSVLLNGSSVSNYNSNYTVSWSSSGNGTWDYTNSNGGINPVYIFGSNDTSSVTLTMSALPNAICPQVAVTDAMVVTIRQNPTIIVTSNEITMCGETFTMPDLLTVNNGNSILWTNTTGVSGTPGVLTNATTETPIFTPSANEIANGFALLTVTSLPQSGCSVAAVTVIKVNLRPKAIVNAGANVTACQGEIITINNGASVQNYTTYAWSENGTGTIDPATINTLNPKYYPGANETGVITFALQATNLLPCAGLVTQTMTVTISSQPTVNAGPDVTICQNTNYTLGTATVANNATVLWTSSQNSNGTSSGTYVGGTFSSTTIINPTYAPSQDDINLGYVYLTVRANSTLCSSLVSDVIKITISKEATVAAGSDATICEGTNLALAGASQSNATTLVWTSSQNSNGTSSPTYVSGSFSSTSILNPIYTPSTDDVNSGQVYLTLTGSSNLICPNTSSQIVLNIVKKPTVSTTDIQMCMNTPQISLNGVASNYQSFNWSIYSGPGSISPNLLNPFNPTFISGISGLSTVQTTVVRLFVTPNAGCPQATAVYDDLVITIQPLPSVEAGVSGSVCYVSGQPIAPFAINGSSVTNASSQNWTSSGVGIFTVGTPVLYQSLSNSCTSEILTLTANGIGMCSASTSSDSVTLTVNCSIPSLGTIASNAPTTICQGASASYSIPANSNVQSYTWSVPSGATIQSGQNTNTIQVLYSSIASSGNITVTATNGCGSAVATLPIVINILPTSSTVTGPQSVCAGTNNVVYTATLIPNATSYVWTLPNGTSTTTATNTISISFGANEISGNLSVSGSNSCGLGSVSTAFPITINPQPSLSSSLTPPAICSNSQFSYVPTSTTAGTTFAWTRATQVGISNLAASGSNTINEILINTTPNAVSVSYQITATSTQGCTNTQTIIVIVSPAPSLTSTTSPAAICSGSVFNYTPTSASAGTISWVRNAVSGIVELASNGSGTINEVLTNSTTLPITVTYLLTIPATANGCIGATSTPLSVTVNPSPQVAVNSLNICFGTSQLITATPSILGTYSYVWTVPSGVLNPGNVGGFSVNTAGTYSVVITNTTTLCSSASATGTVTIVPLPIVTLNNATICEGTTTTLVATPSSVGAYTYTWTVPTGATNPGNTASVTSGIAGIYSVSITNTTTNCTSLLAFGTITFDTAPLVNITNPSPVCSPNTVDITATTAGSSLGLTFSYWNNSSATIAIANPTSISISGTYYIKGTNAFGCFTIQPVIVVINPSPIATISGQNSFIVCQNSTQPIITFSGSNGTAPYTFSYQINGGPIQTITSLASSNISSVAIPTTTAGNYTITLLSVQDSGAALCGSSNINLPNSAFVEVQQVGAIIPINQVVVSQTVCQGTPIVPIIFTIGGASTNAYVTNLPAGLNGVYNLISQTLTISGTPLTSGIFNYVVNTLGSTNGCNAIYGGTINVNSNDSITALTPTTVNQTVCSNISIKPIIYGLGGGAAGGIVTFSPNTPVGISWSIVSNVMTISGASNAIGTFTYTVQSFGFCGQSTASGTITINNNVAVTLVSGNPSPTICSGTSFATPIQYSIASATATMILSGALPTGVTFNAVTGILSGTPTQSGLFPYTISSSTGCGNSLSGVITVSPVQSISYVSGNTNQVTCQYSAIDPINFLVSTGVNAITISPAFPAGITYSLNNGIVTISGTPSVATSLPQNYTITTQGACGPQVSYSVTFTIRPEATITLTSGSGSINQAVCQGSAILPITFTVGGGATGIIIPTLPAGLTLTSDPLTGIYTIQGNPSVNGIFNFPITTTGCPKTLFITISNVNSAVGITLTSAVGTDNQTLCQTNFNSPISPITYTVIGATNVVVNGLPTGVSAVYSPTTGQLIISGTSTQAGIFNYTITSLPCSVVKAGVIRVSTPMFITNEVVTNISCSGSNDGAITVTIIGGVAFNGLYVVRWSGPNGFQQNQTTITGLQAGQYVLTGTDAIGCPIPTMTYTVLPAQPINIALQSSTNVSCNGVLGCANLNITGGSGIYTLFTLQYLDPSSQTLVPITPANNNYFNICNLRAGLYYLTVKDSKNCTTAPYLFTIYDYSSLSIESITMDATLCQNTPGKIRIKVNSLDLNLSFYYNNVLVPAANLGNSIYELSIANPTVPTGIIKVKNGQDCWISTTVSSAIITPDFEFTSNDFRNFGYYSVNGSVQFTNLVNMSSIPAEYDYIVWDFGDNTPFKVLYNPADLLPNTDGESFETVFHTYTTNGIYQVTLTVYNHFGCSRKVTKTIIIGSGATMMLPTIFTPNGDGINDMFRPSLMGLKDVSMYIYDDWGNVVYEVSSDVSLLSADWGWNGIEKGQTEPINNDYRYYIIATTINDKKIEKEGRFLLVK